jgi:hypothetical protein
LVLVPKTGGGGRFAGSITSAELSEARTWTFPNAAGTVAVSATAPITLSAAGDVGITSADATHAGSVPLSGTPATNQYLRAAQTSGALSWQQIAYADISGTPDLTGYVPYTGANATVDLGSQALTTTGIGTIGTVKFGSATGVSATATNGVLTLAGLKSTSYNENLTIDFETTENQVAIGTGSGVTTISLGSLALTTTGAGTFGAGATVGVDAATNTAGLMKFWSAGANNYYTTFTAGEQTANATYTLPTAMPDSNKILQSTSAGVLSWVAASSGTPAGANYQIQYYNGGAFGANANFGLVDLTNYALTMNGRRILASYGTTNSENIFLGQAGNFTMTGTNNILAGYQAGLALTEGVSNNFIGYQAGYSNTTGSYNNAFGYQAGYSNATGSSDVFLGYQAGYYETGSNKLFIDNTQRASEADARIKALIYGVFNAATASQSVAINGSFKILEGGASPTYYTTFTGGDQAEMVGNISYTLPIVSANGLLKNASGTLSWDTTTYNSGSGSSGRVAYWSGASTLTSNSAFTFNGTTLTAPVVNVTTETSGYMVDSIRVLSIKGSSGSENLLLGQSGNFTMTGTNNILAGYQAGVSLTSGVNNVFIGTTAGYSNATGSSDVFLGYQAGYYETGSNKLFIDDRQRASEADARTKALVYGIFDDAVANQTLTVNGNTNFSSGLTTLNYGAEAPVLATNGQLAVAYVGSAARLYFRANGTTYYIDKTGGFGIPAPETIDPISGDKMEIGDIVLGMINQNLGDESTPEKSSLHGVWVKWDSLKAELIQEIKANGGIAPAGGWASTTEFNKSSSTIEGVDTTTMLERVTNILSSLGITIKNGITSIKELAVEKSTTQTARIQKLEMVDEATGDIYCTWIENGDWQKAKGDCSSIKVTQAVVQTEQPQASAEEIKQEVKKEVKQELKQEVENQVESKVESEVKEQLQDQQSSQTQLAIASLASIDDITVAFGTALSDIGLPTSITAVVSDSTQGVLVMWDGGTPAYDSNIAGTYVFSGTLNSLPDGIANPDDIKASINIIVQPAPAPEEQTQTEEQQTPIEEQAPEEQPSEIIPPVGELIQDAASSLFNGVLEFAKWLLNIGVQKAVSLDIIKKTSAGLAQEFQGLTKSIKISLEKTTPSLMRAQTASVLEPVQNFWSAINKMIRR